MVLLTKVDLICPVVRSEGVDQVYYSKPVDEAVKKASNLLGIPGGQISPIRNYVNETEKDVKIDLLAAIALKKMLDLGEGRLRSLQDTLDADADFASYGDDEGSGNAGAGRAGTDAANGPPTNNLNV